MSRCRNCQAENPDNVLICQVCGEKMGNNRKPWHSLHNLLWGNKINQDILDTLNELSHENTHLIDVARKLKKPEEK